MKRNELVQTLATGLSLALTVSTFALVPRGQVASTGVVHVANGEDDGAGSLRAAIRDAAPQSTIDFAFSGTLLLMSGELAIHKELTITGPGATMLSISHDVYTAGRILSIVSGTRLNLSGVTLSNGRGAPRGAILNLGTRDLDGVQVRDSGMRGCVIIRSPIATGGCFNASAVQAPSSR